MSFGQCQKEVTVSAGSYTLIEKPSKTRAEKNSIPKMDEQDLGRQPERPGSTSCIVEDFRYMEKAGRIYISGATSCSQGRLHLRLYNAGNNNFLGSKTTYIRGYTFQTFVSAPVPQQLRLEYSVDID